jgi:hypothetical protein
MFMTQHLNMDDNSFCWSSDFSLPGLPFDPMLLSTSSRTIMAVPREMHFFQCHQTLFAKVEGRDVMMYPMNSCEGCEKQRKGVTWKTQRYESGQTKTERGKKRGNVPRRDLKKEGKNKRRRFKGQLSATVAEATGAAGDQLRQAAGSIAESSRTVRLATHSSSYHPPQHFHQIRGSQVLALSPNRTAMPQVLAHMLRGLRCHTCRRLLLVPDVAALRLVV